MSQFLIGAACAAALAVPGMASAGDMAELKQMIEGLKSDYEARIKALERRVTAAEQRAAHAEAEARRAKAAAPAAAAAPRPMGTPPVVHAAPAPASAGHTVTAGSAFNPALSVILDGNYYHDGLGGEGSALVGEAFQPSAGGHGHDHGEGDHAHGALDNGFNFREAEIAFSATVDPWFDATAYVAIDGDGTVELEEGWFRTRAVPWGLTAKAGKFLSDFGYINRQHPHQWDFADQNLAYLNLLGDHGLQDTGLQVTWVPDLPVHTRVGAELLQGDQERFGALVDDDEGLYGLDEGDDGPRLWTLFAKVAPDLGYDHALQVGVSYARASQHQELHIHTHGDEGEEDHEEEIHTNALAGDGGLWGIDLVYKYDGTGDHGHRDFKFQAEYLRSVKDLTIESSPHPEAVGTSRKLTTGGLYAQAVYGFAPKLTAGLRYDVVGLTNEVSGGSNADFGSSDRWTINVTWNLSEFSRLRAQYSRNDILVAENGRERFDAFWLQFIMSLGAHGAHGF